MSTKTQYQIPPGYIQNAKGDLIKEENLTELEREENKLVKALFPRAEELYTLIGRFKFDAMKMVEDVIEKCVKDHGIKRFEKIKGNVQFVTVDGKYKVQRAIDDKIDYDSSIEVARQKFDLYIDILEQQSGSDAKAFIAAAFSMKDNRWSTAKLIDLCNKKVEHPLYKSAVDALRKSLFVSGSKAYLRFYIRNENDDSWAPMPLQFSSIPAIAPEPETAKPEVAVVGASA